MPARYQARVRYLLSCDRPEVQGGRIARGCGCGYRLRQNSCPRAGRTAGSATQGGVPGGAGDGSEVVGQRASAPVAAIDEHIVLGRQPGDVAGQPSRSRAGAAPPWPPRWGDTIDGAASFPHRRQPRLGSPVKRTLAIHESSLPFRLAVGHQTTKKNPAVPRRTPLFFSITVGHRRIETRGARQLNRIPPGVRGQIACRLTDNSAACI